MADRIPSPFQLHPPQQPRQQPVVKKLELTVSRPRSNKFLDLLAQIALSGVGAGSFWSTLFTSGWAHIAASVSFGAWLTAASLAIIEHSKNVGMKQTGMEDEVFIKKMLEQF